MHSSIPLTKENEGGEMDEVIKRYWILDAGYWMLDEQTLKHRLISGRKVFFKPVKAIANGFFAQFKVTEGMICTFYDF